VRAIFLPGVGVDGRLFQPQRELPFPFEVPAWLPVRPREALPSYAKRFAASLGRADLLVGVSFGGILAQEIAPRVKARLVVGIATGRHRRDVPRLIRFAELVARNIAPLTTGPGRLAVQARLFGGLAERHARMMVAMMKDASPVFVREAARMVCGWEGADPGCPARFLHGREDLIMRPRTFEPDEWVEGAGHLVNLTHARRVNAFVRRALRESPL